MLTEREQLKYSPGSALSSRLSRAFFPDTSSPVNSQIFNGAASHIGIHIAGGRTRRLVGVAHHAVKRFCTQKIALNRPKFKYFELGYLTQSFSRRILN